MKRKILAALAAAILSGPAQAATMEFSFHFVVSATVVPVTEVLPLEFGKNRTPFIDPDAAQRRLDGLTQLTITGRYDSSWVQGSEGVEFVSAAITSTSSDVFGTVITPRQGLLIRSSIGEIAFQYEYPNLKAGKIETSVFDRTLIMAIIAPVQVGRNVSLTQFGEYRVVSPTVTNLYGIQGYLKPEEGGYLGFAYVSNYHSKGADKLDARDTSNGIGVGRNEFDLYVVPEAPPAIPGTSSVPEPSTWAMMIAGIGAIGVAMRRRKVVGGVATRQLI